MRETLWKHLFQNALLLELKPLQQVTKLALAAFELILQITQLPVGSLVNVLQKGILQSSGAMLFDFPLELFNALVSLQRRNLVDAQFKGYLFVIFRIFASGLQLTDDGAG